MYHETAWVSRSNLNGMDSGSSHSGFWIFDFGLRMGETGKEGLGSRPRTAPGSRATSQWAGCLSPFCLALNPGVKRLKKGRAGPSAPGGRSSHPEHPHRES